MSDVPYDPCPVCGGDVTRYIETHREEITSGVRGALSALDGSVGSAVSLLTGLSADELDELGGFAPSPDPRSARGRDRLRCLHLPAVRLREDGGAVIGREDHWTRDEKGARDAEYFRALDEDDDRPTAAEIARDEEGDR